MCPLTSFFHFLPRSHSFSFFFCSFYLIHSLNNIPSIQKQQQKNNYYILLRWERAIRFALFGHKSKGYFRKARSKRKEKKKRFFYLNGHTTKFSVVLIISINAVVFVVVIVVIVVFFSLVVLELFSLDIIDVCVCCIFEFFFLPLPFAFVDRVLPFHLLILHIANLSHRSCRSFIHTIYFFRFNFYSFLLFSSSCSSHFFVIC